MYPYDIYKTDNSPIDKEGLNTEIEKTGDGKPIEEMTLEKDNRDNQYIKIGIVTNCKKLNVREEPDTGASIVCEIVYQTDLMIDEKESTEDFYKVCTASGVEGFCMKKFVAVQP